jgi:tetratricopeptide (TPR) repeat protein
MATGRDVFISYSQEDKSVADAICAVLESAGVRCWIAPRDIQPGRSFAGEITRGIQASKVMVLVFSAHSNKSEQVLREVQLAVDSHLHIIQFRIENVPPSDDLKYFLGTPHWLDALTPPLQNHIKRLTSAVQPLLNVETPSATSNVPAEIKQPVLTAVEESPARRFKPITGVVILIGLFLAGGGLWLATRTRSNLPPGKNATITQAEITIPTATPLVEAPSPTASATESPSRKNAEPHIQHARALWKKRDLDAALAEAEQALELNPRSSEAYTVRGLVKNSKKDIDGAIADYNKALELNPKNAAALDNLGLIESERGNFHTAIRYFDECLEIDSSHAGAFANRGKAKSFSDDPKGALVDYNRATNLDLKNVPALEGRSLVEFELRNWGAAAADMRNRCDADPATQDYFRMIVWVAQSHLPDINAANRELKEFMQSRVAIRSADWPGRIGNFLLDKVTADEFLNKNSEFFKDNDLRYAQALMFAGMKSLSEGNKSRAIQYFQASVTLNPKKTGDYRLARAELKFLGH